MAAQVKDPGELPRNERIGPGGQGTAGREEAGDLIEGGFIERDNFRSKRGEGPIATSVERLSDAHIDPLFDGVVEATEEAILNALLAADTMAGRDDITAHALPAERLVEIMARYGRGPAL